MEGHTYLKEEFRPNITTFPSRNPPFVHFSPYGHTQFPTPRLLRLGYVFWKASIDTGKAVSSAALFVLELHETVGVGDPELKSGPIAQFGLIWLPVEELLFDLQETMAEDAVCSTSPMWWGGLGLRRQTIDVSLAISSSLVASVLCAISERSMISQAGR